jgi:hypothetical protein
MKTFKNFIQLDEAPLSPAELRKYDWRAEDLIKKIQNKEPLELVNAKKTIMSMPENGEKKIRDGSSKELSLLRFKADDGNEYKLSDILKNKDFGGKGAGSGTAKEDIALKSLISQIDAAKSIIAKATIPIKIGNKIYDVYGAASTPGTPKSDFHLIDINGKEIVWISHKDGKTPKDFQQWGGVSAKKEPTIYKHTETQAFINDIKTKEYPNNDFPRATTLAREIKDLKLKNMSIYGNQFGKSLGQQNVTILLQGNVKLVQHGELFTLESFHSHLNGELMSPEFEPVFLAIYKGDRSDFGIKGVRVVIAPRASRKITRFI